MLVSGVESCPPQKGIKSTAPADVAKNMVFTDAIMLGCIHTESGWASTQWLDFIKTDICRHPHTQRGKAV